MIAWYARRIRERWGHRTWFYRKPKPFVMRGFHEITPGLIERDTALSPRELREWHRRHD